MNKKTMLVLGAGSALALCNGAYADDYDLTFTPRVGVGMQNYKMEWSHYDTAGKKRGSEIKIDEYIPTFTLGGSVSMGRLYLDTYLQQTGTSDETASTLDCQVSGNCDNGLQYFSSKADRRDYAIALGYGFENGLSLSGGYKYGKTDISVRNTGSFVDGSSEVYNPGYAFTADGPFLALGYGLNLGAGTLSLTGAIAFLDGKTSTKNTYYYGYNLATNPSATGLALSLAWKAPITKQFTYGVHLDMYKYDFDKQSWSSDGSMHPRDSIVRPLYPLKVTEESVGIKASLSYSF